MRVNFFSVYKRTPDLREMNTRPLLAVVAVAAYVSAEVPPMPKEVPGPLLCGVCVSGLCRKSTAVAIYSMP